MILRLREEKIEANFAFVFIKLFLVTVKLYARYSKKVSNLNRKELVVLP